MTVEVKQEAGTPVPGEEQVQDSQQTPEVSDVEKRALEMGWRPKDEFDGDEVDFIDAKEFVRRKPLFDKIATQSHEIKNVRKALEALQTHYTKVQQTEYNRALAKLKEARTEAISNADGDSFEKIDTEIKRVEQEAAELQETQTIQDEPQVYPEFEAWTNRNQWYSSVKGMRDFADELGVKLARQGKGPSEVLKEVEVAVRKEFPHRFKNPNKESAPDVESGSGKNTSRGAKEIELSEQERKIMNTLVSTKVMTKDEYLADLKKIKGIK